MHRPGETVDLMRAPQRDGIEPAAAPFAAGGGAELLAARTELLTDVVEQLGRKRPGTDARGVGLGDAQHIMQFRRAHAGTARRRARAGVGRGHVRIGAMIDIQQRALCTLEQHRLAGTHVVIEQRRDVGYHRPQAFGQLQVLIQHLHYTPTSTGTFYIVVKKVNSSQANRALTLFSTGPDLVTRTTASSILQPADCAKVIGVGAVNLSDNAESFSSEGPTTDGRAKPEIAAPDGVKTSLPVRSMAHRPHHPMPPAPPHSCWPITQTMTPAQLRAALPAAVKDVNSVGFDYRTGSGRISLDADGDGLNHDVELSYATSPILADTDGDGLTDSQEIQLYATSPTLADSDGDGLSDGQEVLVYFTNPNLSNKGDLAPRNQPDGVVNVADLMILTRFVGGLDTPSAQEFSLADGNNDGVLDVRDILQLRQQLGY